jgi:hypothetical protein
MPVIAKGNKIIEKDTGKVVGTSKTAGKAKAAANIRNAITECGFKERKVPKGRPGNAGSITSVRT